MLSEGDRILAAAGPTISVPEAAKVLGIGRVHAYNQARTGFIAGIEVLRIGKCLRIPTSEVRRVVRAEIPAEVTA